MSGCAFSILLPVASINRKPPTGKVVGLLQAVGGDVDQLEAAAAEIAGDAVGLDEAHHDALGRRAWPPSRRDRISMRSAARLLGAGNELGAVLGLAHGGGGEGAHVLHFEDAGDGAEAHQRRQRAIDASPPSLPVEAMARPSPHSTFSLNSGVGARTAPS